MRQIQNDDELLTVAQILLKEVVNGLKEGKYLVFTPDNIELPEEKEVESAEDFVFKGETQDIDQAECFRLLGVTLYHLVKDQSEYNHEAYLVDGTDAYLNLSFESTFWPVVVAMLQSGENALDNIRSAIKESLDELAENKEVLENQNKQAEDASSIIDDRFELVTSFELKVPDDYDHASRLNTFFQNHEHELSGYDRRITDDNFAQVSTHLTPGQELLVKIFQINKQITHEECLSFLRQQKAILVGAQGASLVLEHNKENLPDDMCILSLDKVDTLYQDHEGDHCVPYLERCENNIWGFGLGYAEHDWHDDNCFLCFCEIPEEEAEVVEETENEPEPVVEANNSINNRMIFTENRRSVDLTDYPVDELVYQESQAFGPNNFLISDIEEWYHPDIINGRVKGTDIHEYILARDDLDAQLGLCDLRAIQLRGIDFYQQHFGNKFFYGWKSIAWDSENGNLCVPYLHQRDEDTLSIQWSYLSEYLGHLSPGLRFKELTKVHLVNCNVEPFIPYGWDVRQEDQLPKRVRGIFDLTPEKIRLYFPKTHGRASFYQADKILTHLKRKPVLTANVLDYLIDHPQCISEEYKNFSILFWGTIYQEISTGYLYVRYLYKNSANHLTTGLHKIGHSWGIDTTAFALLKDTSLRRFIPFFR